MHRLLLYTQTFFTNNKLSSIDFVYEFCDHRQKFEFVCTNIDHRINANQFLRLLVEGFSKPQQISVPFYLTFIVKPTIYIHIWIYIRIYIYRYEVYINEFGNMYLKQFQQFIYFLNTLLFDWQFLQEQLWTLHIPYLAVIYKTHTPLLLSTNKEDSVDYENKLQF